METKDIVVRVVRLSDVPQLQLNCFSANTTDQLNQIVRGNLDGYAKGDCIPLVAEVGGVVIGSATLVRQEHPLHRHRAEVDSVVVCPQYQRQGVARRLIESLRDLAASAGVEILEISARGGTAAEEVYRRLGFREYGLLPRGLQEPWGAQQVFDEIYFWMPLA